MSLRRLRRTWDAFGREDPLWAILSHKDKKGNRWNVDDFMRTGAAEVAQVLEYARAVHTGLRLGRALDFGCGVGRLSQALAAHFETVDGVDIAPSMIDRARELNGFAERVRYHLNEAQDLGLFESGGFDFLYSNITLQHMPPESAKAYLREFARVLAPGGLAVVQVPGARTERSGPRQGPLRRALGFIQNVVRGVLGVPYRWWIRTVRRRPVMDMFAIPRPEMERLLGGLGLELVDVVEDTRAGPDWRSFRYCARKPG